MCTFVRLPAGPTQVMRSTHYYLVDTSRITPGTAVSQLVFEVISTAPFTVEGLQVHRGHVCPFSHTPQYGLIVK